MTHSTKSNSLEGQSQGIQQVTNCKTGEQMHIVYAIPPGLIEGVGGMDEGRISLADLVRRLWRGKWLIVSGGIMGMLLGVVYALSQPNVYTAEVTALPPFDGSGGGGMAQYAGLAAMAGIQLPTGPASSVDEIMAILESRRLADPLIEHFKLESYYRRGSGPMLREDLLAAFSKDFTSRHSQRDNRIIFGYTHEEPQIALAVALAATKQVKDIFNKIHQTQARREKVFLEERLRRARSDQRDALEALAAFQRETGAIEIETQTKVTVEAIAELQGELIGQQVELRALLASQVNEDNPRIQLLQERIIAANEQMRTLLGTERVENGVLVALGTAPELSVQYLGLLREVKKQEAILSAITAQHQAAEVNVARASEAVSIVDEAVLPEKKSGPARLNTVILSAVFGIMLGIFANFFPGMMAALRASEGNRSG